MQNSLRSHLAYLQDRLQQLTDDLTRSLSDLERAEIEKRIRNVNEAIEHYRRAYEIEVEIRDDKSPEAVPTT